MLARPATLEPIRITIHRTAAPRSELSRRPGAKFLYSITVPEIHLTAANGGLALNDTRDLPWTFNDTSLDVVRRIIKSMAPNATVAVEGMPPETSGWAEQSQERDWKRMERDY